MESFTSNSDLLLDLLLGFGGDNFALLCADFRDEHGVDVGKDTSLGDGDATEEFVELFVVADGELNVSWDDSGFLVVARGVAGKL